MHFKCRKFHVQPIIVTRSLQCCDGVMFQVPFKFPAGPDTESSEESGGDAALGEEGPTECDCEPGEPGFAGFAGPKVSVHYIT